MEDGKGGILGRSRCSAAFWVAALIVMAAALLGCEFVEEVTAGLTPTPAPGLSSTSRATGPATVPPDGTNATATAPESTAPATPQSVIDAPEIPLVIAPVEDDIPKYNRRDWRHWRDEDRDCQNARQEVLIEESSVPVTYETSEQCRVAAGVWLGSFTGEVIDDPRKLDIDHMVPLANAHRSGGWAWDRDRKAAYANDLGYPGHLIAVDSSANRAKGSKGPEDWRPPNEGYWCEYATHWVEIKSRWELTVTQREWGALEEMLGHCDDGKASEAGSS